MINIESLEKYSNNIELFMKDGSSTTVYDDYEETEIDDEEEMEVEDKKEFEPSYLVYNYGSEETYGGYWLKVKVFSDGKYEYSLDGFEKELLGNCFVDDFDYIFGGDKDITDVVKKAVVKTVKKHCTKDSLVKAHIYSGLSEKGYSIDMKITNFSNVGKDNGEKYSDEFYECLYNCVETKVTSRRELPGFFDYTDIKELGQIIKEVFVGDNRALEKYNDILDRWVKMETEALYNRIKDSYKHNYDGDAKNILADFVKLFESYILQCERAFSKQIVDRFNINISLRQAYSVLPEEYKVGLADAIYANNGETKFLADVVSVLENKCKKQNGEVYSKKEIINFLSDVSMSYVVALMPEDFDGFANEEIEDEEDFGRGRQ